MLSTPPSHHSLMSFIQRLIIYYLTKIWVQWVHSFVFIEMKTILISFYLGLKLIHFKSLLKFRYISRSKFNNVYVYLLRICL